MSWIPWIEIKNENSTNEEIKNLYKKVRNPLTGKISDLNRITSLTPEVSENIFALGSSVYRNAVGLTAREKEIIALVTSSFIGCVHWTASHLEALGRVARNLDFAAQVAKDYTKANLNKREKLLADFSIKITRSPDACCPEDIQRLKDSGLSEKDILSLVEIVAYQNMSTRIMESLSTVD